MARMMPRKRPPKARTVDITGVWTKADAPYYHVCCECQLTHPVEMKLEDGQLYMRWIHDPKETAKERRKKK